MYCYLLNYRLPDFWLMVVNNRIVINISVRKEKTKKKNSENYKYYYFYN